MHGLDLKEMAASDMLDVLHYFMEEDMDYINNEQLEAKSEIRSRMYDSLYGVKYQYATTKTKNSNIADLEFGPENDLDESPMADVKPFNPREASVTKGYVPPTALDANSELPFGSALDAPL